ncbi:hypothetical protein Mapa_013231 [Marchantia paleacea]|nr:hypothetical protein Mapa_013231 [Marchantia paleacea]
MLFDSNFPVVSSLSLSLSLSLSVRIFKCKMKEISLSKVRAGTIWHRTCIAQKPLRVTSCWKYNRISPVFYHDTDA